MNFIILIFYSGQLFGFFFSSLIGNMVRAKIMMVGGLFIAAAGAVLLCFSNVLELSVVGMWMMNFGLTAPFNLTFIFITEMV